MHLDWLVNPVTFYSGASVCLLTSLALFVSIKIEMARARSAAEVSDVVNEVDDLAVRGLKAEVGDCGNRSAAWKHRRPANRQAPASISPNERR
jgi:hypothetical protein